MTEKKNTIKAKNPFAAYQQKRKADTIEKVKSSISRIKQVKGKVSYHAVSNLAGRTEQCIRNNKDAALLVERAIAEERGGFPSAFDSGATALPTDIHECHALIRILKTEKRELNRNISTYRALIKRYNISSDGTISEADKEKTDAYKALLQVMMNVLSDGIYRLDTEGLVSASGKKIASKILCNTAGLGVTQTDF